MPEQDNLTLAELAARTGVSERTIRYYIQFRLLPAPGGTGPKARYGQAYLGRLWLIRSLQDQHLPLSAIRKVIDQRSEKEIERIAGGPEGVSPSTALGYVKSLLAQEPTGQAFSLRFSREAPGLRGSEADTRSHWERFQITADIELHVRRPLSKSDNRRLEELLKRVRELFPGEDTP